MNKEVDRFMREVIVGKLFDARLTECPDSFLPDLGSELDLVDVEKSLESLRKILTTDEGEGLIELLKLGRQSENCGTARSAYYWGFIDCINYILGGSDET